MSDRADREGYRCSGCGELFGLEEAGEEILCPACGCGAVARILLPPAWAERLHRPAVPAEAAGGAATGRGFPGASDVTG